MRRRRSSGSSATVLTTPATVAGSSFSSSNPPLPTVSGTAELASATTGRSNAMASISGTQKPS
jgi:hypothetical protein